VKHILLLLLLLTCFPACEKRSALDEAAIRSWASSADVLTRNIPSIYTYLNDHGGYVAVAAGDFIETADGIDLKSMTALTEGFYVFPEKIWVRTIDEAIRLMSTIEPGVLEPQDEEREARPVHRRR